jgi:Sigma-70, region 4
VELWDEAPGGELRALLHEAINGLPRGLRLAIVLCELEGRSPRSTANQLGWPLPRLKTRLVQARRRLQARMAQQGVFLPVSQGLGEWLGVGKSVVPRRLIETTVQVVTRQCNRRAEVIRTTAARSAEME